MQCTRCHKKVAPGPQRCPSCHGPLELTFADIARWSLYGLVRRVRSGGVAFFGGIAIIVAMLAGATIGVRAISVEPSETPRAGAATPTETASAPETPAIILPWARALGGEGTETATGVDRTPSGDFLFVGRSDNENFGDNPEILFIRTDQSGETISRAVLGVLGATGEADLSIGTDGAVYAAGRDGASVNLLRLSRRGETIWAAAFPAAEAGPKPVVQSIVNNGVVAVAPGEEDNTLLVGRLGPSGIEKWRRTVLVDGLQGALAIAESPEGGFYLSLSATLPDSGDAAPRVMRFSEDGTVMWRYDFVGRVSAEIDALSSTPDGALYIAGVTPVREDGEATPWLARLDPDGTISWEAGLEANRIYGPVAMHAAVGNDIHVAAAAPSEDGEPNRIWLARFDRGGGLSWESGFAGEGAQSVQDLITTPEGDIVIAGAVERGSNALDMQMLRLGRGGVPPSGLISIESSEILLSEAPDAADTSDEIVVADLSLEPGDLSSSAAEAPAPEVEAIPDEAGETPEPEALSTPEPAPSEAAPSGEEAAETEAVEPPAAPSLTCTFRCTTGGPDDIKFPITRTYSRPDLPDAEMFERILEFDAPDVCQAAGGEAVAEEPPYCE